MPGFRKDTLITRHRGPHPFERSHVCWVGLAFLACMRHPPPCPWARDQSSSPSTLQAADRVAHTCPGAPHCPTGLTEHCPGCPQWAHAVQMAGEELSSHVAARSLRTTLLTHRPTKCCFKHSPAWSGLSRLLKLGHSGSSRG